MFPHAKKGELSDVAGYYVMEERDLPSEPLPKEMI